MPRRPPTTDHRAPSSRAFPSDAWTLDLIRQAEVTADSGNLRWAAELCDAIQADDRVKAARLQLGGLFGLPLTFEDGVGRLRRRARRAIEAEEDWWSAFSDETLLDLLMWGVILGVALARISWVEERGRVVPRLAVWHPRALRWDPYAATWKVRLAEGNEIAITPGDGTWVLYTPQAEHEPWKHGAWKAIARWWRAKRYAIGDWGKHSEQASGLKVATTEDGTDADRERIANDLMGIGGDAALALPPGWDLEQLSVASSTVDVFDRLIDAADDATTVSLLGQNLTTEVKGGSYSATSVHETVSRSVLRALASSLAGTLRAQVLVPWSVFNFGAADVAPWPAWDLSPPTDKKQDTEILEGRTRVAVALAGQGAPVDWRAFAEAAEIPLRAPEEEVLTAGAPIYGYHLQFGIVTINEARARVGLPPIADGNRVPTPPELVAEAARTAGATGAGAATLSAVSPKLPAERRAAAGQAWVDELHTAACEAAPEALAQGIVGQVRQAVGEAKTTADLRARLEKLRGAKSPAFRQLVQQTVLSAAAAGAHSARSGDGG